MAKEKPVNKYGVREGDIFVWTPYTELADNKFYQVIALRGSTQVVIRPIQSVWVATDGIHMQALPVLDSWIWQEEEGMVRKVHESNHFHCYINVEKGMYTSAHPYDRNRVYLDSAPPVLSDKFECCDEDVCYKEFDLEKGYGVYSLGAPFTKPLSLKCIVVLRRPGRKDEQVIFSEMLEKPFKNSLAGDDDDMVYILT